LCVSSIIVNLFVGASEGDAKDFGLLLSIVTGMFDDGITDGAVEIPVNGRDSGLINGPAESVRVLTAGDCKGFVDGCNDIEGTSTTANLDGLADGFVDSLTTAFFEDLAYLFFDGLSD
jgi:hypothetical protein